MRRRLRLLRRRLRVTTAPGEDSRGPDVDAVHVVVPAHDEAQHVSRCLESVLAAVDVLHRRHPTMAVDVAVVLDRCTDRTADIVLSLGVVGLEVVAGNVGAARRAGLDRVVALSGSCGRDPTAAWVCNTDADCIVPETWLLDHVALARGHDIVLGEVRPMPGDLSAHALSVWDERNPAGRGSLHGANLGVRLAAYVAAGGFPAVADQEDLLLVRAMKARGATATGGTRVLTSGRRESRVPGGFAGYLRALDTELAGLAGVAGVAGAVEAMVAPAQAAGSGSTPSAASTRSSTSRSR